MNRSYCLNVFTVLTCLSHSFRSLILRLNVATVHQLYRTLRIRSQTLFYCSFRFTLKLLLRWKFLTHSPESFDDSKQLGSILIWDFVGFSGKSMRFDWELCMFFEDWIFTFLFFLDFYDFYKFYVIFSGISGYFDFFSFRICDEIIQNFFKFVPFYSLNYDTKNCF